MLKHDSILRKILGVSPFLSPSQYNWSWNKQVIFNQREHLKFMQGKQSYEDYAWNTRTY